MPLARRALILSLLPSAAMAQQHRAAPPMPLALPGGMAPLQGGAYRLAFRTGETALPAGTADTIAEIARRFAANPGRITVEAQASGPSNDASSARRIALARAIVVRDAMVAGGVAETRIDVRALGRVPPGIDAADLLPPGSPPGTPTAPRPTR